jgi:hypothetical protein
MARLLSLFAFLVLPLGLLGPMAHAQNLGHFQNFCSDGGQGTITSGLLQSGTAPIPSGTPVASGTGVVASYPGCTVSVFLTGTTTLASIFSNNLASPTPLANPFTASTTDGTISFYAPTAAIYDITISGAGLPSAYTWSAVTLPSPGGGGSGILLQTNGVTNSNQGLENLVAGANITLTNVGGATTITSTGGGGGGVGGSGTPLTLPIWTFSSTLGNSGLSEPSGAGSGLNYSGGVLDFATTAIVQSLSPGSVTQLLTANTTGTTVSGGISLFVGTSGGTAHGGLLFGEAGPSSSSGAGGEVEFVGGPSSSGTGGTALYQGGSSTTGTGGPLLLNPGINLSNTNGDNGIIVLGSTDSNLMMPTYFPGVTFANLLAPTPNPFPTSSANGAWHWCSTCLGAVDNAPQGSVAGSGGHGAYIAYDLSTPAWRVVSGVGSSATGTVNNATQYSLPYYSASGPANTINGVTAPTVNGTYYYAENVTGSAAVAPILQQSGICGRSIKGSTTTDLVAYSDMGCVVTHDQAATGTVTVTLPTATTLGNTQFGYKYCNNSPQTDSIAPTTWTIQANATAAASTLSVATGTCYLVRVDFGNANQWLANH